MVRVRVSIRVSVSVGVADCCIQTAGKSNKMRINHVIKTDQWQSAPQSTLLRIYSCPQSFLLTADHPPPQSALRSCRLAHWKAIKLHIIFSVPIAAVFHATTAYGNKKTMIKQEDQLMLTNLRDVFVGQSMSPNMVPFHMLHIVSYCAIVTLSLRPAVFTIFDFKNVVTLKAGSEFTQGH